MDDFKFNSIEELYRKLLPALTTKANDLKRNKINYLHEEDIWNYLRYTSWNKKNNLTLGEMVNDILCANNDELIKYAHNKNLKEDISLL